MELRQLKAFEAVATSLHFGRAADRLFTSQSVISEQIRRLEQELGTQLFHRTSRRVELTPAGAELLGRARAILTAVDEAAAAVRRVDNELRGSLRVAATPPAAPVLAPHLIAALARKAPAYTVDFRQMWQPDLQAALVDGTVDVGLSPGTAKPPAGTASREVGCEPLLVGLRPSHRLASRSSLGLDELGGEVLGIVSDALFPAWVQSQRAALSGAGIAPPTASILAADISAVHWQEQAEVDWILLTPSLAAAHRETAILTIDPPQHVTFSVFWRHARTAEPEIAWFVDACLTAALPVGWTRPAPQGGEPYQTGAQPSP
jgi:DNA-binding transcriptional LysR family regulator